MHSNCTVKIVLSITLLFFTFPLAAQEGYYIKKEEEQFRKLLVANKVAACSTYTRVFTDGSWAADSLLTAIAEYDSLGLLTHYVWYNWYRKNQKDGEIFYKYDSRGNELAQYNASGQLQARRENFYDSSGNLVRRRYYLITGALSAIRLYTYDAHANRTGEYCFGADSVLRWWTVSTYNSNDDLTGKEEYRRDSSFVEGGALVYNRKGEKTGFLLIDPKTKKRSEHIVWTYDNKRLTRENVLNDHDVFYKYYENGLESEQYWVNYKDRPFCRCYSIYRLRE